MTNEILIATDERQDVTRDSLRITEIFCSLQGEGRFTGLATVFVRLTGCPLRCSYCDTEYAFYGGQQQHLSDIVERTLAYGVGHVTVTGGEPLAQKRGCERLLTQLCNAGLNVSLETSGALSVDGVDSRVSIVLDLKTPDSGEAGRNMYTNLSLLKAKDQIKFVLCSRADYEWARAQLAKHDLVKIGAELLFSPSFGVLPLADLAQWILDDRLPVRMQTQLHKQIWGDEKSR